MAGPISSMDPTGAIYIHIESNSDQLRISRHSHDPTPAFTAFDCPGAATTTSLARASPPSCSVPLSFTIRGEDTLTPYDRNHFESAIPCFPKGGRSTNMASRGLCSAWCCVAYRYKLEGA
jgi:hypothetical protein